MTLGNEPFVLVPSRTLGTPEHINELCIAIPPDYRIDALTLHDQSGAEVHVSATLTDTNGKSHPFTGQSFLFGQRRYVCLGEDSPISLPGVRYKQVVIRSSASLRTDEIRWISTDKL
jgi:hypothetical protein